MEQLIRCDVIPPPSLKPQKAELGKRNIERGEGRWVRDGDIVYIMWRDTKVVTIMSTMHHASGTETVVRKVKDKDGHLLRKEVSIPPAILDYNLNMGGIDLSDQAISYYNILRKTHKYWRTLFTSSILWSQMHSYSIEHTYRRMSRARLHSKNFERNWLLNCVK